MTLEEKIRKERPPPRIRVMEGTQPGFTSLRLENVGITFRDQEVLKDVTWGVKTGDRIGLVGANGAGKTSQLRIMAGEMEPTTGDVLKSSKDLRVAMLRQEFVDELVRERTLKEEFMSVFSEENQILQDIRDAEVELENLGEHGDPEHMQEILDRMQKLQAKADAKDVYALESKTKKVMDLMGFTDDEGDDLVASFSGGWKMRIGLGKVLLKDPNILLLDEPVRHEFKPVSWVVRQTNICDTGIDESNTDLFFPRAIDEPSWPRKCGMAGRVPSTAEHSHGNCESRSWVLGPGLYKDRWCRGRYLPRIRW